MIHVDTLKDIAKHFSVIYATDCKNNFSLGISSYLSSLNHKIELVCADYNCEEFATGNYIDLRAIPKYGQRYILSETDWCVNISNKESSGGAGLRFCFIKNPENTEQWTSGNRPYMVYELCNIISFDRIPCKIPITSSGGEIVEDTKIFISGRKCFKY